MQMIDYLGSDYLTTAVPLAAGTILLLACVIVVIARKDIPNMLAGFLLLGGLLCVAPNLKDLIFEGWGIKVNVSKSIKETTNDIATTVAQMKLQIAELQKATNSGRSQPPAAKQPTVLISYADGRRGDGKAVEAKLLENGFAANAVYDDLTQVQNKLAAGSNSLVYSPTFSDDAKKVRSLSGINFAAEASSDKLTAAPIQIRLF